MRDAEVIITDVDMAAAEAEYLCNPNSILNVPTQMKKLGDTYFIVDCYNNQVIYSDNPTAPLYSWRLMTSDINMGHTIASDGTVYLVDDTENNRVLVFEKRDDNFVESQVLNEIGNRPHYIVYNEANETFYVWSSMTGEMYLMCRDEKSNTMYIADVLKIDALDGVYVRSFTIVDDEILFVSGNCCIIKAGLEGFDVREIYQVPESISGMVQIMPVEDKYLITVSTDFAGDQSYATIIQADSLEGLIDGEYEDVYSNFVGGGTPYYMTENEGVYYLTEHRIPGHSVWSFEFRDGKICNVQALH